MTQVTPIPKPRKRIIDTNYLRWLTLKPCLYCGRPSTEPHHVRAGEGPGKGSMGTKPDDYRALNTCPKCHNALHGRDKTRLKWMTERIGREEILWCLLDNLIEWHIECRDLIQDANNYLSGGGCGGSSVQRAAGLYRNWGEG